MSSTRKQFTWKDRDTAARDLLQVAYYAPPYVSTIAIRGLQAIRSAQVVPELQAIARDDTREIRQRIYGLQAIAVTPGDIFVPALADIARQQIAARIAVVRNPKPPITPGVGTDLLSEIRRVVEHHPSNRAWFFSVLDEADEPAALHYFLNKWLDHFQTDEFRQLLVDRLLRLLDEHSKLFTLDTFSMLLWRGHGMAQNWLDEHFDTIVDLCRDSPEKRLVVMLARRWSRLQEALSQNLPELSVPAEEVSNVATQSDSSDPAFLQSPAYLYLRSEYESASSGNYRALRFLIGATRQWKGPVPWRAAATHFIGKLNAQFNTIAELSGLLQSLPHSNEDDGGSLLPIRIEAGEALLQVPTGQVWEILMNALFIHSPRAVLGELVIDWITHITNVLSGEDTAYSGRHYGPIEKRGWFKSLADISSEEVKRMTREGWLEEGKNPYQSSTPPTT